MQYECVTKRQDAGVSMSSTYVVLVVVVGSGFLSELVVNVYNDDLYNVLMTNVRLRRDDDAHDVLCRALMNYRATRCTTYYRATCYRHTQLTMTNYTS